MIEVVAVKSKEVLTPSETELYLEIREELFEISKNHPQLKIPQEDGSFKLKNTILGVVKNQADADKFIAELNIKIPQYTWFSEELSYDEATNIIW